MNAAEEFRAARISPIHTLNGVAAQSDVDDLGHINNIVYLRWVQDAAGAHSEAVGFDLARYQSLGAVWVVRKHEITYLASAMGGDAIEIKTWVEGFKGASSPRRTEIFRVKDGATLARCITLWALIDPKSGRPTRIPPEMKEAFQQEPGPPGTFS